MKAIWKEFFRLKWEEISELLIDPVLPVIIMVIFFSIIIHFITSLITLCMGFNGLFQKSFIIYPLFVCFLIIYWLHSNWQQAKKNVEDNYDPK